MRHLSVTEYKTIPFIKKMFSKNYKNLIIILKKTIKGRFVIVYMPRGPEPSSYDPVLNCCFHFHHKSISLDVPKINN